MHVVNYFQHRFHMWHFVVCCSLFFEDLTISLVEYNSWNTSLVFSSNVVGVRVLRSSENQTDGVVSRVPIPLMSPSLMI